MLHLRLYALASILVVAACSGERTAVVTLPSVALQPHSNSVTRSKTLYVTNILSSSGGLTGYSVSNPQLAYSTSDGLNEPEGIAVNSSGAVYVANTYGYNILKFKPPVTSPVQTIKDRGYRPTDIALDSKGNIWVANWCSRKTCGPGNIEEFDRAGTLLHIITCPNLRLYTYLAIDGNDNVVVDGDGSSYSDAGEIAAGSTTCSELPAIHDASAGGVAFLKNGNLSVIASNFPILTLVIRSAASKAFISQPASLSDRRQDKTMEV